MLLFFIMKSLFKYLEKLPVLLFLPENILLLVSLLSTVLLFDLDPLVESLPKGFFFSLAKLFLTELD